MAPLRLLLSRKLAVSLCRPCSSSACRASICLLALLAAFDANAEPANTDTPTQFRVEASLDVAEVPSGFPVGFCLLTEGDRQYVAYYDKQRRMTVASRSLDSNQWQYQVLPSRVGWDSHNYITMAVDRDRQLHVSGNMHNVSLIYYRTERPGAIDTLQPLAMTGERESRACYPRFLTDDQGEKFPPKIKIFRNFRGITKYNVL